MYPILLVFAFGMAIAIERWIHLSRVRARTARCGIRCIRC